MTTTFCSYRCQVPSFLLWIATCSYMSSSLLVQHGQAFPNAAARLVPRAARVVGTRRPHFTQQNKASTQSSLDDDDYYNERLFHQNEKEEVDYKLEESFLSMESLRDMDRPNLSGNDTCVQPTLHQAPSDKSQKAPKCRKPRAKHDRLVSRAQKMALQALNLTEAPSAASTSSTRQQFQTAVGVHKRLLNELEERASVAQERARQAISEREAELAALRMTGSNRKEDGQPSRLSNLQSMEETRQEELQRREQLTSLVLRITAPLEGEIDELSTEELLSIVRIRGNLKGVRKGVRRVKNRARVLELLFESFATPLY